MALVMDIAHIKIITSRAIYCKQQVDLQLTSKTAFLHYHPISELILTKMFKDDIYVTLLIGYLLHGER
jgi:hypothetical protein